jgi:hypothetical protein
LLLLKSDFVITEKMKEQYRLQVAKAEAAARKASEEHAQRVKQEISGAEAAVKSGKRKQDQLDEKERQRKVVPTPMLCAVLFGFAFVLHCLLVRVCQPQVAFLSEN